MAVERTLSIIKPDATRRNLTGKIIAKFEDAGLRVVASRRMRLSKAQAEAFYGVHRERPFFNSLVEFMTSGPVVVQVLEGENAIAKNREVMGATNPANAAPGTIRKEFAESHRGQFRAWFRRPRYRCQRDQVLFQRSGYCRLSCQTVRDQLASDERPQRLVSKLA